MTISVAFGVLGNWKSLAQSVVDPAAYDIDCVNFERFDLTKTDIAVPLTLADAAVLRDRHRAQRHKFLVPSAAVTALCHDKKMLNETLLGSRFAHLIPPIQETATRTRPYVLKRRDALSGQDIFIIGTPEEEAMHEDRLRSDRYFCQAYVDGSIEYATHMLIADGALRYHFTNQYRMAPHAVKGDQGQPLGETFGIAMAPRVLDEFTEVLRLIGFEGACCIDYKIEAGQIRLLEINPRCGFSLFRDINRFLQAYSAALGAGRAVRTLSLPAFDQRHG